MTTACDNSAITAVVLNDMETSTISRISRVAADGRRAEFHSTVDNFGDEIAPKRCVNRPICKTPVEAIHIDLAIRAILSNIAAPRSEERRVGKECRL